MEVNKASYEELLRIPGIGVRSARKIMMARRVHSLSFEDLKKIGVVLKRAKYFLTCKGKYFGDVAFDDEKIKNRLLYMDKPKLDNDTSMQLSFFDTNYTASKNNIFLPESNSNLLIPNAKNIILPNDKFTSITGEI